MLAPLSGWFPSGTSTLTIWDSTMKWRACRSPPASRTSGSRRLTDLPITEYSQRIGQPAECPDGARDVAVVAGLVQQRLYPVHRVGLAGLQRGRVAQGRGVAETAGLGGQFRAGLGQRRVGMLG